jgi:hypothetical protein
MSAVWGRSLQIALKLATIIQFADDGTIRITEDSWERARRLTEYALQSCEYIICAQHISKTTTADSWVLKRIRTKPGIALRELNRGPTAQRHGGGAGIRAAIEDLLDAGLIKTMENERGTLSYFDINAEILPGEEAPDG